MFRSVEIFIIEKMKIIVVAPLAFSRGWRDFKYQFPQSLDPSALRAYPH
jgi:hypothetical protein